MIQIKEGNQARPSALPEDDFRAAVAFCSMRMQGAILLLVLMVGADTKTAAKTRAQGFRALRPDLDSENGVVR
jgi:hypothetical protein